MWTHCGKAKVGYEIVGVRVIAVDVIDHIGLGVVLLFCTHGLSLGRTKLHKEERNERNGTACRVGHNASEMKPGSSLAVSLQAWEAWQAIEEVVVCQMRTQFSLAVEVVAGTGYAAVAAMAADAVAGVAELVRRSLARTSLLARQDLVILLLKVRSFVKVGLAVMRVSLP